MRIRNFDQIMRSKETDSWSKTLEGVNTSGTFSITFLPSTSKEQLFLNSISIYNNGINPKFDISAGTVAGSSIQYQMGLNSGEPYRDNNYTFAPLLTTIGTAIQLNVYGLFGSCSANMNGYSIRKSGELFIYNSDFETIKTCRQVSGGTCILRNVGGWVLNFTNWGVINFGTVGFGTASFDIPYPNQYLFSNGGAAYIDLPYRVEKNFLYSLAITLLRRRNTAIVAYYVQLMAGTTMLTQYSGDIGSIPPRGGTARVSLNYLSDNNTPELGKNLRIELYSSGVQVGFDDISLIAYDRN